jgi:hypothetical protein
MRARLHRVVGALGIALWLGCAADQHAGPRASEPPAADAHFPPSGFLGDYSALKPGDPSRARLVYLDANADFSGYERVIVEPVVVWKSDEARFAGVTQAQREALAREFEAVLERAFADEFVVAKAAGPGTLRVRNALTAAIAEGSDPERLQYIEVELELRDAVTNARLAAAVDSKQDVEVNTAFQDWAERVAVRVAALRDVDRQPRPPASP